MMTKLLADLDRAGRTLASVKQAGKKLSATDAKSISNVIRAAKRSFDTRIDANKQALGKAIQQRVAIFKSAKEGLLTGEAGKTELANVREKIATLQVSKAKLEKGYAALKQMANLGESLTAASPELERLEKGHASDAQIKDPAQAPAAPAPKVTESIKKGDMPKSSNKVRAKSLINQAIKLREAAGSEKDTKKKAMLERKASIYEKMADKLVPEIAQNVKEVGQEIGKEIAKEVSKEVVKELTKVDAPKGDGKETPAEEKKESPAKESKETPAEEKAEHEDKPSFPPKAKADDKMAARKAAFKAYLAKKKQASAQPAKATIEVKANDKVMLSDGSTGIVSSISGDKIKVSIGGVEKDALISTVKRIASEQKVPASKGASIADKVKSAVTLMRNGGKKVVAEVDAIPAASPDAPKATKDKLSPSSGDITVKSETNLIGVNPENGKFTVTTVENEVKEFETEEEAKRFIGKVGAKRIKVSEYTMQSMDVGEAEGSEGVATKLKGLDQSGKDYGTTSKEEKVNPTMSVAKASKEVKATAMTKDSPVDSATTKVPDSSEGIASKLKGLDQSGKDYGTTSKEEKINPQLSIYAQKLEIVSSQNKKMASELAKFKSKDLVARALKVGAITEGQVTEQMTVLAELHANSPAEFNAFERLIANMEAQVTTASIADRPVRRIQAAMANRQQVLVDHSTGSEGSGSLDNGTFFDDNI